MAELNTGEKRKGSAKSKRVAPTVDMTPMVDLAFLLITFFLLTTTFEKNFLMQISFPDRSPSNLSQKVKPSQSISIIPAEDGYVYWYDNPANPLLERSDYSPEGIRKVLLGKQKEVDTLIVIIKPMPFSTFENVIDLLDEVNITKVPVSSIGEVSEEEAMMVNSFMKK